MNRLKRFFWGSLTFGLTLSATLGSPIFDYGSDWKYFIGTSEASAPDSSAWRSRSFDDTGWALGKTPLGYANPANSPAEESLVTILPSSQERNYLSVFCRKKFSVNNPAAVAQLILNVNIDDGYVAWLNGVEISRFNVPDGNLAYNSAAASANEPSIQSAKITQNPGSLLVAGENVLAVQVFNGNLTSSDLVFDAALESDLDESAPTVTDMAPPAGATVSELNTVEIVFSESVQGVDAADLQVNGAGASGLTVINPRDYVFSFAQPVSGSVRVGWVANHGITDTSTASNAFVAGASWNYTLDTNGPPPTVLISEFMADNENGIKDDNGDRSDWIEIYNSGSDAVNLDGWFLTDSTNNLVKWRIPSFFIPANGYLLVWASGKNRSDPSAQLHTNFKLEKSGGYLALAGPRTNVVSEFANYPAQRSDVSYGRDVLAPTVTGYFNTPTPRSRNSSSGSGFAAEPVFSHAEGVYTNASLSVTITAPSGQIRYTVDGTVPTATSTLYTGPISVTTSTTVKARIFESGLFPGPVAGKAYLLVDSTVANFKSKLPVMMISTSGRGIVDHPAPGSARTFASIAAVDTFRGLSSPLGELNYIGQGGISIRGQTSSGFPKKPYRLELTDPSGNERDEKLFGLPEGSDWILNNPYTDKPFLQNFLAYELFEKMGHYSVRRRFVEVFVNTTSGKISYPRDYVGIYILLEKIKVDNDRVDIERLTPYDTTEPNISGGYMFKKDKDTTGDRNFTTQGGAGFSAQTLKIHEPAPREISTAQVNWLANYLKQFERALYANDWKTATGTNHYSYYIDVDSFVDHHWIVEFAKQIDGYRLSNYFSKDRNGKVKMEPIWDYNLSFGNADYLDGQNTTSWYWSQIGENEHIWFRRLMSGTTAASGTTGDPDFLQRIADRWSELRTNVLASSNVLARVDELAALLSEAAARDFQKFPRLGTYVWPNPSFYVTPTTYAGVISAMKTWISGRARWIDTQFQLAPTFSVPGGRIPAGLNVALSGPGTIYYTTDGSDPRLPGGSVSAKAIPYSGPIQVGQNMRIVARSRNGPKWSGPTSAGFVVAPATLMLTEIMYHPEEPPLSSSYDANQFEYLEFKNTGTASLNLAGFRITEGVDFTFPNYSLPAGARVLVVKNRGAFESRYGTNLPVAGQFGGQLDNAGERITLLDSFGAIVLSFKYEPGWRPITDGAGFSLELIDDSISADQLGTSSRWQASATFRGSPGAAHAFAQSFPAVVVNEARTRPGGGPAMIELLNTSATAADVGGWFLTDNFDRPMKYRFPNGTTIAAGGFLVVTDDDVRGANALSPFSFNPLGEEIYLFSGNVATNLTGYVHGFKYGVARTNETFGRYITSAGQEKFVLQSTATIGSPNAGPLVPPVVLSEIMFRPPDVFANGALWNNTEDEYLELYNRSGGSVTLADPSNPANRWRISGDVSFAFPAGTTLAPGAFLLVANFNPVTAPAQLAAFREKYKVPANVQILGPFSGNLDNAGGRVSLSAPDAPLADGTVPEVMLEEVQFRGDSPWPAGADGLGFSLNRKDVANFGDDPANWVATASTAGGAASDKLAPVITEHPASQLALARQTVRLSVAASGPGALRYQWRVNGANLLGETNATLTLSNAQPAQSGSYSVVVLSADASTASKSARVTVATDNDNDSMDDAWELANGFNPFDPADGIPDTDGDGVSNRAEYIAGTDPRDAKSFLAVSQITAGAQTVLRFRAVANRAYIVQFTDSLDTPNWQKLLDVASQDAEFTATVTDPAARDRRYYRISTQ